MYLCVKLRTMKKLKYTTYQLDELGVRPFVGYSEATGKFNVVVWHKNLKSTDDGDWKMIRVGHIASYSTRKEAEKVAIELAVSIAKELGILN